MQALNAKLYSHAAYRVSALRPGSLPSLGVRVARSREPMCYSAAQGLVPGQLGGGCDADVSDVPVGAPPRKGLCCGPGEIGRQVPGQLQGHACRLGSRPVRRGWALTEWGKQWIPA
jgi:hypothetical protein